MLEVLAEATFEELEATLILALVADDDDAIGADPPEEERPFKEVEVGAQEGVGGCSTLGSVQEAAGKLDKSISSFTIFGKIISVV